MSSQLKPDSHLKYHHIIWTENLWLDWTITFCFIFHPKIPHLKCRDIKYLHVFTSENLAESRKVNKTNGDACRRQINTCSCNATTMPVNKWAQVDEVLCCEVENVWNLVCIETCPLFSASGCIAADQNRPDQTRWTTRTRQKLQPTAVKTI